VLGSHVFDGLADAAYRDEAGSTLIKGSIGFNSRSGFIDNRDFAAVYGPVELRLAARNGLNWRVARTSNKTQ
jgi:hypothetical protein